MKILFVTDYLPYPLIAGDFIRNYNLIWRIAKHHQVSLIGFFEAPDKSDEVLSHFRQFCYKVEAVNLPRRGKLVRIPRLIQYALAGTPVDLEFLYSEELVEKIRNLMAQDQYDIVQIEQSRMAVYLDMLPTEIQCKRILVFHNVAFSQYDRISKIAATPIMRLRAWLHSAMLKKWEPRYASRFDRCFAVSKPDRDLILKMNPLLRVNVIPNGVDTHYYQPVRLEEKQPALLFIGNMAYEPCSDGALWFFNEILPYLQQKMSDIQVWIVGNNPPEAISCLDGNGVHVTGRVDDVVPYYQRSSIAIVPIRAGGGTRLKIMEAMALGRPVVSTTIGCEGLEVEDGRHILMADHPIEFAEKVLSLLKDGILYRHIVDEARRLVVDRYDWDVIAKQQLDIYAELLQEPGYIIDQDSK